MRVKLAFLAAVGKKPTHYSVVGGFEKRLLTLEAQPEFETLRR
jgi:hypothetical protein